MFGGVDIKTHALTCVRGELLAVVLQIPGLQELHDRHLSAEPAGVPDQHCLQEEPHRGRLRRHEVTAGPGGFGAWSAWTFPGISKIAE